MPVQVTGADPAARAKTAADTRYGAQQSAVERAIAALQGSRDADIAGINMYGDQGRTAINETYGQLAGNLETNRQLVNRDLGIQVDSIGQGYRDANAVAEAARTRALDNIAKTYGNNSAYSTVNQAKFQDPIETLAAQVIGQNARSDATYTGNLQNWAAQQDALMQGGIAGAQRDKSSRLSSFETELMQALAASKNQRSEQEFDYQGKLLDLIGERGNYQAEKTGDYADTNFDQTMAAAGYNLNENQYLSDASYKQAQLAQSAQELAMKDAAMRADAARADRAEAKQNSAVNNDDYWKQLEYDLKVRGLDTETAKWLTEEQRAQQGQALGAAQFLGGSVGIDEWGDPFDYSAALEQILGKTGYNLPGGMSNQSAPSAGITSAQMRAASPSTGWTGNSAYGSKTNTSYTGKPTPLPRGVSTNMGANLGFR